MRTLGKPPRPWGTIVAGIVLATLGCSEAPVAAVLTDQNTGPANLTASVVRVASDAGTLQEEWTRHRLDGEPPVVNYDDNAVLITAFGQSSSCPYDYGGIDVDAKEGTVEFLDAARGRRVCTDDFVPRTIVVAIGREALPPSPMRVTPPRADDPVTASVPDVPTK